MLTRNDLAHAGVGHNHTGLIIPNPRS